jgi:hypothetical protein
MENKKLLYIGNVTSSMYGGSICSKRNLDSIKEIYGEENVKIFTLNQEFISGTNRLLHIYHRLITILQGYMLILTNQKGKQILNIIKSENISTVFLDSSLLGKLVNIIKKKYSHVEIITFFHNVEFIYLYYYIKTTKDISMLYWIILSYKGEQSACKYSDKIITLNARDANLIKKIYGKDVTTMIPISINDSFDLAFSDSKKNDLFTIMFIRRKPIRFNTPPLCGGCN